MRFVATFLQFLNAGIVAVMLTARQLKLNKDRLTLGTIFKHWLGWSPCLNVDIIEEFALVLSQVGSCTVSGFKAVHLLSSSLGALLYRPSEIEIIFRTIVNDIIAIIA